jgi:ribonuclease PH
VEVQGTAEREPFTAADLTALTRLAKSGITKLMTYQQRVLGPRLIV